MLSGASSAISITYEKQKGKDAQGKMMTTELLKRARAVRGEIELSDSDDIHQSKLEYNQAAYNIVSAIILATQRVPKKSEAFFDAFLFREDASFCIWKNIFDGRKTVFLELELEEAPTKMKLEDIKKSGALHDMKIANRDSYVTSTTLQGSSFAQPSLSEFLLENGSNSQSAVEFNSPKNILDEDIVMEDTLIHDSEDTLFEIDVFNKNPCMLSLREVIQKLHTEISVPEEESTKMPSWMQRFHRAFTDYGISLVVQLYLAKVIINYPVAFEKFASFWIEPLMKLVVRGREYGQPMNYFVQDLCIILIAWGRNTKLPDTNDSRHNVSIFLSYLVQNVYHETPRVSRGNLQIFSQIFKNWGQFNVVPTRVLYDEFSYKGDLSTRNLTGIQVTSVVLNNNINPYYNGIEVDIGEMTELQFYDSLSENLLNQSRKGKVISVAVAELMGFVIKYMNKTQSFLKDDISHLFKAKLQKACAAKNRGEIFICSMDSLCKHDISIAEPFFPNIVLGLSQYTGAQRIEALNVIRACWTNDQAFLHILNRSGLLAMISYRDTNTQIAVLKLLNKIFENFTDESVTPVIEAMADAFIEHESIDCKVLYYSFLKKFFNPPRKDIKLQQRLKTLIFKGLVDSNKSVAGEMFDYIESVYELENDIKQALLKITHNMYTPDTEDVYLLYCTQMILRNCKKSHQFEKPIFENQLPNARFDANYRKINTSWQKNFSMTPLFAQSQETVMNSEDIELNIRSTQRSIEFSQTQTLGKSIFSTFNPTQEAENEQGIFENNELSESFLNAERPPFKNSIKNDYYQMRFTKPKKGASNRYHANRNEELKKRLLHLKNIKKEAQDKEVTMCRGYRVGELPDIQISYKDLLNPLEVVSSSDYNVSRLLYSSLVVGIVTEDKTEEYKHQVAQNIISNLYNSTLYFTPTIGSFLRIFFDLDITSIESSLVKKASSKSSNHHIGISLLEKQLMLGDVPEISSSKKRKLDASVQLSKEKERWVSLALQYKAIDELGAFRSIYQNFVAIYDGPKTAIDHEVMGDYASAYNQFADSKRSLFEYSSSAELELWQEEMLYCYEKLTQWDDIVKEVHTALPDRNYTNLWNPEHQDPYLHYFLKSFVKLKNGFSDDDGGTLSWSEEAPNPIFNFIERSLKEPNEKEYLLRNYGCDMALSSIYQKKYNVGEQFIRASYESLLTAWTTLHPLAYTSRLSKLAELERIVELEDYLNLVLDIKKNDTAFAKVPAFFKALTNRYPDRNIDSINLWDDIIESRMVFIDDITNSQSQSLGLDKVELQKTFLNEIVKASSAQHNFNVFSNRQNRLKNLGGIKEFNLNKIQHYYSEIKRLPKENPKRLSFMQFALSRSLTYNIPSDSLANEVYDIQINKTNVFGIVKNEIIESPTLFEKITHNDSVKKSLNMLQISGADQFVDYLETTGYNCIEKTLATVAETDTVYTNCLWKFGQYCDNSLKTIQSNSMIQPTVDAVEYCKVVINCYMKAMDRGHKHAAEKFPRLLELIELYPDTGEFFVESSESFGSTWLYIGWIPQLVAILDLSIARFVYPVVKKLAKSYPKALYYPFYIGYEHYQLAKDKIPEENIENIEKIKDIIRSPLMEDFCLELKRLTDPEHIIRDFVDYLHSVVLNGNPSEQFIEDLFENFNQLLLNPYSSKLGSIPKAFAKKHGSQLMDLMGKKGSKLKKMDREVMKKISKYVDEVISKQRAPTKTGSDLLRSYSPWLASYKNSEFDEEIEVPGQYKSIAKPFPESHAKISSVDSRVLVMASIRKPKRIRIYGTDEREYLFLVKGGEDLRLDQRIEQIFTVMNNMISKNTFCLSQNICIATYNVIPMATNLGLIEWVDNTKPLRACIEEELDNKSKITRMQDRYRGWIATKGGKGISGYQNAFAVPRTEIAQNFKETSCIVKRTHLRDFLMRLSSSPEAFLFLRKNFAHSLAAISIYGYILGIGDRHLENFLLDLKSGRLIPIDFGHAFGSATEMLPIPELVPFRLTTQIVGALEPLGVSGILELAMVNVLEAIQNEKELLLNIMDIFVKEPLLDWKKAAARQTKRQTTERPSSSSETRSSASSTDEIKWYPQQKIDIARKKLEGANPADIYIDLLKNGHGKQKYFESACHVVRGEEGQIRSKLLGKRCQDSKELVKCLVNLATDPSVLGLMWIGWQSYL
ncbi:hypothetical protein BY458DRAFT_559563 [Sporodiniella umbellata]|nr:hypothetical protein BY458DRAFT_559563 [Sporodiniella umbellata]